MQLMSLSVGYWWLGPAIDTNNLFFQTKHDQQLALEYGIDKEVEQKVVSVIDEVNEHSDSETHLDELTGHGQVLCDD